MRQVLTLVATMLRPIPWLVLYRCRVCSSGSPRGRDRERTDMALGLRGWRGGRDLSEQI